jgi:hypothetical protein
MYRVARQLHAHLPAPEIVRLLTQKTANCGRYVSQREIQAAVQNSLACAWTSGEQRAPQAKEPKWPRVAPRFLTATKDLRFGLADLWECSPRRITSTEPATEEIIDALFPGNPLLCCGKTNRQFATRPREEWRGELSNLQFIVPSPMTARTGTTREGRVSAHTLDNTGPRRFLVVEFDNGPLDSHAAMLMQLSTKVALVLVVHSGGKSLHGWFYVERLSPDAALVFMRIAVSVGADTATWTRSQFVRIPDGTRATGERQTAYYFNPSPLT